ncbi:hypothetical protein BRADI_4g31210v3 [Brachypodium distachyon]|uniref:Serine protease n=1 Tax=Brachypodium distachyon TaxID=15368 RepID=A0A2K2CRK5_BRADI|nr:hypothetical protein BRADI_4g31210v3 [Brachypodium distachyon]
MPTRHPSYMLSIASQTKILLLLRVRLRLSSQRSTILDRCHLPGGQAGDELHGAQEGEESHAPVPDQVRVASETQLVQRTFENHHRSVVRIFVKGGKRNTLGTGFVVHHDGATCLVLTCYHTFQGFDQGHGDLQISVNFSGMADDVPAQVFRSTANRDLVLLRVLGDLPSCYPPVVFSDEMNVSGRDVVMIGFFGVDSASMLVEPGASRGRIMGEPVVKQAEPICEHIISNYTIESGTSGGPIFMEDEVVGVNAVVDIGKVAAISVRTVKSVLMSWIEGNNGQDIKIPDMLRLIASKAPRIERSAEVCSSSARSTGESTT